MAASGMKFDDFLGTMFGNVGTEDRDTAYRKGLLNGFSIGFAKAREKIAQMLEEEGKGQTAQRVRKLELLRK